jgi:hypothetical protein
MSPVMFSVRRRDLAWSLALIVLLSAVWVARSDIADAGGDPPVADFEPTPDGDGIPLVYIAVGTGFADALGVGPGAGLNGAPVIIVSTNPPLNAATQAELIRLDPRTLIIIGGFSAVSQAMQDAIAAVLPNAVLSRIAGNNRYETNAAFSAATFPVEGWASIPSAAFTADEPDTDNVFIEPSYANNGTGGALFAPIQLPHGAKIIALNAGVWDTTNLSAISVYLYRIDNSGDVTVLATAATTEAFQSGDATVTDVSITTGAEMVDNEAYAYMIAVFGANGPVVRTVKVQYQLGASTN